MRTKPKRFDRHSLTLRLAAVTRLPSREVACLLRHLERFALEVRETQEPLEVPGLGRFVASSRKSRVVTSPGGEAVEVPRRIAVAFRPSRRLRGLKPIPEAKSKGKP